MLQGVELDERLCHGLALPQIVEASAQTGQVLHRRLLLQYDWVDLRLFSRVRVLAARHEIMLLRVGQDVKFVRRHHLTDIQVISKGAKPCR